jgi:hypothetical protein
MEREPTAIAASTISSGDGPFVVRIPVSSTGVELRLSRAQAFSDLHGRSSRPRKLHKRGSMRTIPKASPLSMRPLARQREPAGYTRRLSTPTIGSS